ncbi:MAG TPA: DUF1648 domain-containing protein [Longimicrobiales bacterium]
MSRFLTIFNVLLAVALVGLCALWYSGMPDRIPIHFDLAGRPDGWGSRASFIVLPLIGLLVAGSMAAIGRAAVRNPGLMNIPGKATLLELAPEAQREALEPVKVMMDLMATLILLLFHVVCASTYRASQGHDVSNLIGLPLYALIAAMLIAPVWMMIAMKRLLAARQQQMRNS